MRSLQIIIIFIFAYLVAVGANWNGVITPTWHLVNLGLITLMVIIWLLQRNRANWQWHRTPFDFPFMLWAVAFIIAFIANPDVSRRSLIGLWYMMLYIGLWYVLQDAFANGFKPQILINALIISGIMILLFGVINIVVLWGTKPVSLLGNTNAFAAYLLAIIPFSLLQMLHARYRFERIFMAGYALLASLFLIMTFSRGGWLGFAAQIITFTLLMLLHNNMLSFKAMRAWFSQQSSLIRRSILLALTVVVVGFMSGGLWIVQSLSIAGRSFFLRAYLWESALGQFLEKPLTGQGLFAYGYDLGLCACMPIRNPQSHAHSLPFQVAAELGLPGLIAMVVTIWIVVRVIRQNWHDMSPKNRPILVAAIAVLVGYGVHQLVDTPIMMPVLALLGWLTLNIAMTRPQPILMQVQWRKRGHPLGMITLFVGLILSGAWSTSLHLNYRQILQEANDTQDYQLGAEKLEQVIQADPNLAIYTMQQAYLYGLTAVEGNDEAARLSIEAYNRFLQVEPYHAVSWANKAALHWQLGQPDEAIAAIEQALRYAENYPLFQRNQQIYLGESFDEAAYEWEDYVTAPNFMWFQYLRDGFPMPFLPQVNAG